MNWRDRIGADPEVLVGKAVIKGTSISVELVLASSPAATATRTS